jgi:hypothetical protein
MTNNSNKSAVSIVESEPVDLGGGGAGRLVLGFCFKESKILSKVSYKKTEARHKIP